MPLLVSRVPVRALCAAALAATLVPSAAALASPGRRPPRTPAPVTTRSSHAADLSNAFSGAASRISASVVSIRVEVRGREEVPFGPFGLPGEEGIIQGGGSGVVVRRDGYVLTNHHVVANAIRIEIRLRDGRRFLARVVGTDPAVDLAVLKVDATDLQPATFASSDSAQPGEWVVAVGSPFGLDYTVTAGVLSAIGRGGLGANEIEDYLQTDASINPGNSGGPLVDLQGNVVGINTMIIGRGTGIGFAIPSDLARLVADQIIDEGRVRRAWLGVSFQEMTPELAAYFTPDRRGGALVSDVVLDGPAARAGVRPGDVIVAVDDVTIEDGHGLLRQLLRRRVGQRVRLSVLRDRRPTTLDVTTADRPDASGGRPVSSPPESASRDSGMRVTPLDEMTRERLRYRGPGRLVIREVLPGSNADHAGLVPGDVIVQVDRQPVDSASSVERALTDGEALVEVQRRDRRFFTVLRVGR